MCHSLSQITIPPSVKTIKNYAFMGCHLLDDTQIPSSVTSIDIEAFKFYYEESKIGYLLLLSLFPIVAAIFSNITSILSANEWWSLIHPWFEHGYKTGKKVYLLLETCMISSICFVSFFIIYILLYKYVIKKKLQIKRYKKINVVIQCICIISLILMCLISNICGLIASSYAFKNEVIDGKPSKCMRYIIEGCQGVENWIIKQSLKKQNEFKIWYNKMLENSIDNKGEITNYYCKEVGEFILITSLMFPCSLALILVISVIVAPIVLCRNIC